METKHSDIFIRSLLQDRVKLKPNMMGKNIQKVLEHVLVNKLEGKCSQYGYIRKGSVGVYKYSTGQVMSASLNGDMLFTVQYYADVCNPLEESTVTATVINANKFGILAECAVVDGDVKHTVLEIIVAKNTHTLQSEIDLQEIKIGDKVLVEVLGKKYELNDKKISVVGRIVKNAKAAGVKTGKRDFAGDEESDEADKADEDEDAEEEEDDDEDDAGDEEADEEEEGDEAEDEGEPDEGEGDDVDDEEDDDVEPEEPEDEDDGFEDAGDDDPEDSGDVDSD